MAYTLWVVLALSIDAFTACVAYGANNIRISERSAAVISLMGTAFLTVSVLAGNWVSSWIPADICKAVCFGILFLVGFLNFFQGTLKNSLMKKTDNTGRFNFRIREIAFAVEVFVDETKADRDHSNTLSIREALYLAMALSVDSLATGFGIGFSEVALWQIALFSVVVTAAAVLVGSFVGQRISRRTKMDLSWLSGLILIGLAFGKLL